MCFVPFILWWWWCLLWVESKFCPWVLDPLSDVINGVHLLVVSSLSHLCLFLDLLTYVPFALSSYSLWPYLSPWLATDPCCPHLYESKRLRKMSKFTSTFLSCALKSLSCASTNLSLSPLKLLNSSFKLLSVSTQSGESPSPCCSIDLSSC